MGRRNAVAGHLLMRAVVHQDKIPLAHSWPKRRLDDWLNHAERPSPQDEKCLQMGPLRGVRRRASLCRTRPVTPEVAGSSPVAPAYKNTCKYPPVLLSRIRHGKARRGPIPWPKPLGENACKIAVSMRDLVAGGSHERRRFTTVRATILPINAHPARAPRAIGHRPGQPSSTVCQSARGRVSPSGSSGLRQITSA